MKKRNSVFLLIFGCLVLLPIYVHAYPYFWTAYDKEDGLPYDTITTLAADPGGYLWIGTQSAQSAQQGCIGILDLMHEFTVSYDVSDGMCSNIVKAIAFEHVPEEYRNNLDYGAVWIATTKGISILDRKGVFTNLTSGNSALPGNSIETIFINKENTKWISVWGRGVSCVDSEFNWGTYTVSDGLCSRYILAIHEDTGGNVWFGSNNKGVSWLDRDGNWVHFSSANSGLIGDQVRDIVEELPNKLWFVTPNGLSVFDGQNWMSYTSRNSPLGSFIPTKMIIDSSGNKWIGTENGGIFKLDSFGMWTHFHQGNTGLPGNMIEDLEVDKRGTIWIATSAGLCSLGTAPRKLQAAAHYSEFQQSSYPELGRGTYYPFEHCIMWEHIGVSEQNMEISYSLPQFFLGGKSWFYAVLWADHDFSFKDLQYNIIGERGGNRSLHFRGTFSQAMFLTAGGIVSSHSGPDIDVNRQYPFPEAVPEELQEFLLPGDAIPSMDPEIHKVADLLIQPESREDMYKAIKDIVYSKLIQHMALEGNDIGLLADREPGEEGAKIGSVKDVYYVLKNRKGDQHAKARLICTLARSADIPARVVMSMGGSVWTQVWVAGLGWISIQASYPVYDYVQPMRTYMPKLFLPSEHAIASVSGKDDFVGRVLWDASIKAYYIACNPLELKDYRQMTGAKIFLLQVAPPGKVPDNAKVQMDENLFASAVQTDDAIMLVFQDRTGEDIKSIPLSFEGLSNTINVNDRLFWKFIARRMGEIVVLENIDCKVVETTQLFENTDNAKPDSIKDY